MYSIPNAESGLYELIESAEGFEGSGNDRFQVFRGCSLSGYRIESTISPSDCGILFELWVKGNSWFNAEAEEDRKRSFRAGNT